MTLQSPAPAASPASSTPGRSRLPRDLHPVAWWLWAIGLAAAASLTTNPFLLLMLAGAAGLVVAARRSDHPWARSFRLYLWLALFVVVIRVVFRILFGGEAVDGSHVLVDLPAIGLPDFVAGITLLGPVTREGLLGGLYDGLRLGTIIVCVGAANSLANPRRLLRSVPPALYEIGTALVISVTVFPQLVDSARRVRAAQELRGVAEQRTGRRRRRIGRLRRLVIPVLEDALERSLALAAGMDVRGYGRSGGASRRQRLVTGALMLAGLCGLCVGTYAFLDTTAPRWLAAPMLIAGGLLAIAGLSVAGRRVRRSRYRPDRWRPAEILVVGSGVVTAVAIWWVSEHQLLVAYPPVSQTPAVTVTALVAVLLAALPAVAAPPPRMGRVGS